jgi:uncharacterized membrane protein
MAIVDDVLFALTLLAALGCGLMAGFFFAFSTCVMKALARLSPANGIAAMQSINVAVLNPLFLAAFLGTAALCLLVMVASLWWWHSPGIVYVLVGGTLYLVGTFFVTVAFNVPKNNALAAVPPADLDSARVWSSYLVNWTAWNHIRTTAALAATALLTLGLCH